MPSPPPLYLLVLTSMADIPIRLHYFTKETLLTSQATPMPSSFLGTEPDSSIHGPFPISNKASQLIS